MRNPRPKKPRLPGVQTGGILLAFLFYFVGVQNGTYLFVHMSSLKEAQIIVLFVSEFIFILLSTILFIIFLEE